MSKLSQMARNRHRREMYNKYAAAREEIQKVLKDSNASSEEKRAARTRLHLLPRNSSPTRLKNRCAMTGRARGYLRDFGISRIEFRRLANNGLVPGVRKSSW